MSQWLACADSCSCSNQYYRDTAVPARPVAAARLSVHSQSPRRFDVCAFAVTGTWVFEWRGVCAVRHSWRLCTCEVPHVVTRRGLAAWSTFASPLERSRLSSHQSDCRRLDSTHEFWRRCRDLDGRGRRSLSVVEQTRRQQDSADPSRQPHRPTVPGRDAAATRGQDRPADDQRGRRRLPTWQVRLSDNEEVSVSSLHKRRYMELESATLQVGLQVVLAFNTRQTFCNSMHPLSSCLYRVQMNLWCITISCLLLITELNRHKTQ